MPRGGGSGGKSTSKSLPPKLQSARDSAKRRITDWATQQKNSIDALANEQEEKLNIIIRQCLENSEQSHQMNPSTSSKPTNKNKNSNNRGSIDQFHDVKVPNIQFIEYEQSITFIEITSSSSDDQRDETENGRGQSNSHQPQIRSSQSSRTADATTNSIPPSRGTSASRARRQQQIQNEQQFFGASSSLSVKNQQNKTVTNNDFDTFAECPYCFMIFPKDFSQTRQMQHISSHK